MPERTPPATIQGQKETDGALQHLDDERGARAHGAATAASVVDADRLEQVSPNRPGRPVRVEEDPCSRVTNLQMH